ncbi:MAG TPA: TetR family transcriptional regulator [Nocardioidaceae bacterium]|nr:TetR family transcriptional regulator [Nocardioidaceae bacterium]
MAVRARLTQERSRERRIALLDAAIALFAESGKRGVTHRAVATRAGLPTASTTYYFSSIDELVREALTRHLQTWMVELEQLTAVTESMDGIPDEPTDVIAQILASRPADLVAGQLAILLEAARDPQLQSTMTQMLDAFEGLATTVLARLGVTHPERIAASAVHVVAGHALDRLSERRSPADDASLLFRSLRALVVESLLDSDERDAILERLTSRSP